MGKSKSILKKITAKTKKKREKNLDDKSAEDNERESPFYFGGIPSRNVKKNLGCG